MLARITLTYSLLVASLAFGVDVSSSSGRPCDYTVSPVLFACNRWEPDPPARDTALLDIWFPRSIDSTHAPLHEDLHSIARIGGIIVHVFHALIVRAIVPIARLNELSLEHALGVPNADSFVVSLRVVLTTPLSVAQKEYLTSLGAKVTSRARRLNVIGIEIPDRAIPALRARADVVQVEPVGYFCAD